MFNDTPEQNQIGYWVEEYLQEEHDLVFTWKISQSTCFRRAWYISQMLAPKQKG